MKVLIFVFLLLVVLFGLFGGLLPMLISMNSTPAVLVGGLVIVLLVFCFAAFALHLLKTLKDSKNV